MADIPDPEVPQTDYSSYHPILLAADTANMQSGAEDSLIENAKNFTGSALLSGFASVYNTAANLVGAEKFDVGNYLEENDQHMGAFYAQNKNIVDAAGFAITSLVPGGIALKGLQLAKAGTSLGAFGRALGFAQSRQQFWLEKGLNELAVEGGTVFSLINKNKLAATAWATADQVINVAAFETAVALTMKQSPLLENDDWTDIAQHIMWTSSAFGALGGGLEFLMMNSVFKSGTKTISQALNQYQTIRYAAGDLAGGDRAYGILQSMLELPAVGKNMQFSYRLFGKENQLELPTKEAFERAAVSTERRARLDFQSTMNDMAAGDTDLGTQYSSSLLKMMDGMKQNGESTQNILDALQDHLFNVGSITRITPAASKGSEGLFYLAEKIPAEKIPTIKTMDDFLATIASRSPTGEDVSKYPYELVGRSTDVKVGIVGKKAGPEGSLFPRFLNAEEAFAAGQDTVIMANGTIRINPKSPNFVKRDDPILQPKSYYNVRTGAFTDVAYPTIADVATSTRPLAVVGDKLDVVSGTQAAIRMKVFDEFPLATIDTIEASARYAWAGATTKGDAYVFAKVPAKISDTDIPMLERIYQEGSSKWKEIVLKSADGTERTVEETGNFADFLKTQKLAILQGFLAKNQEDLTALGVKLNVEPSWVMKAIESNFTPTEVLGNGFSIPLEASQKVQNLQVTWNFAKAQQVAEAVTGKKQKGDLLFVPKDTPPAAMNVIYGQMGWAYRTKIAKEQMDSASAAVLGAANAAKLVDISPEVATSIADQLGSGSSLLTFSNADYGDPLRLWSQYTGQQVSIMSKNAANAALTELQSAMVRVKDSPEAAAELGVLTTALRRNPDKFVINIENGRQLINKDAAKFDDKLGGYALDKGKAGALKAQDRRIFYNMENDDVVDFVATSVGINAARIDKLKVIMSSRGWPIYHDPFVVYAPPVDTTRYPYFAFVRKNAETMGGSSEVSMITARTEEDLRALTAKVPEDYEVLFKQNTEKFHKVRGDYEYQLSLKEPTIDSTLQRRGVLGDFFPETRPENVLDDYIGWHQRQEVSLVRRAVETRYAQTFEEIRAIGKQFEEIGTSKFGGVLKKFKSQIENPYEDYLKTALDISKRSEYTLLNEANEFVEALGKSAYRIFGTNQEKAMQGSVSWQEANRVSERYGIAGPYRDEAAYFKANAPEDRNVIKEFVSKANMLLVNFNLRLDWANSLINVISTPILLGTEMQSIRRMVADDNVLAGKLNELRTIAVPGTNGAASVPSTMKLLAGAVQDFWGEGKDVLIQRYKDIGSIKDMLSQYHEMVDMLAYKPYQKISELAARGNKAVEIGAKFSGNEWAEEFTRFVSARVMDKLTEPIVAAGKMTAAEQDAYISVFVNRVQGNYLNSQRPVAFQGVLGSAVSLFQTYQFNMLQQLFRHIENRDTKTIAVMMGLQGGLYGMNGIPFFEAVNNNLVGSSKLNPEHKDVYSTAPQVFGRDLGNWLMYGTASAFPLWSSQSPSLYTRGDINPRHISIIPVTPLDVPAVDGSIRFVNNLYDVGKKVLKGADITSTLLEGLEHNSINRPLAGIAQVMQGYATTSKGSLISASNDFYSIATLSRILGAKPMDESIALNTQFRLNAYQAADEARLADLGETVKTKLRNGKIPTLEELQKFQVDYAKAGGRIENYSKAVQRWSKDANVSVVNKLVEQHRTSYSKRMMEIMGGATLPDFRMKALQSAAVADNTSDTASTSSPVETATVETGD